MYVSPSSLSVKVRFRFTFLVGIIICPSGTPIDFEDACPGRRAKRFFLLSETTSGSVVHNNFKEWFAKNVPIPTKQ